MATNKPAPIQSAWQPVRGSERYKVLDALRGLALYGVLLVNLMGAFRISLFDHILGSRDTGQAGHVIDFSIAALVEFKAFALFSFLFGVGCAIQAERASARGMDVNRFLARRFAVLLAIGLSHIVLVWNGDILALYAVCGWMVVPFVTKNSRTLLLLGVAVIVLPYIVPLPIPWPSQDEMRTQAAAATHVYAQGGCFDILEFRCHEAWRFILPLLLGSLPRTLGLMFLGVSAWRFGILRQPEQHRGALRAIVIAAGSIGAVSTFLQLSPVGNSLPSAALDLASSIPLSFAYAAAVLLWLPPHRLTFFPGLAAAGQMALTNYLVQSMVLSVLFYGYGFGLFGKVAPALGVSMAVVLYAGQIALSRLWLQRFYYGPLEWLWRSLTYGHWQPLRRHTGTA